MHHSRLIRPIPIWWVTATNSQNDSKIAIFCRDRSFCSSLRMVKSQLKKGCNCVPFELFHWCRRSNSNVRALFTITVRFAEFHSEDHILGAKFVSIEPTMASGYLLSFTNFGSDIFIGLTGRMETPQSLPYAAYQVDFTINISTNATSCAAFGTGGGPRSSVFVKAGILARPPFVVFNQTGTVYPCLPL